MPPVIILLHQRIAGAEIVKIGAFVAARI